LPRSIQWRPPLPRCDQGRLVRWRLAGVVVVPHCRYVAHTAAAAWVCPRPDHRRHSCQGLAVGGVIEHVIDELKGGAQVHAVFRHGRLGRRRWSPMTAPRRALPRRVWRSCCRSPAGSSPR